MSNENLCFFVSIVLRLYLLCFPKRGVRRLLVMPLTLIGIPPPHGSRRDALFGCDGSRSFFRFNARPETGRKYL